MVLYPARRCGVEPYCSGGELTGTGVDGGRRVAYWEVDGCERGGIGERMEGMAWRKPRHGWSMDLLGGEDVGVRVCARDGLRLRANVVDTMQFYYIKCSICRKGHG